MSETERLRAALHEISTLVVDPNAAASFTYSNLCEAVSIARNALESPEPTAPAKGVHTTASGVPCDGRVHDSDMECAGCCVRCGWMPSVHGIGSPLAVPALPLDAAAESRVESLLAEQRAAKAGERCDNPHCIRGRVFVGVPGKREAWRDCEACGGTGKGARP